MKTKGDVITEEIKVGDLHEEICYGGSIKVEVKTLPINDNGAWSWISTDLETGEDINYLVTESYEHYGPELYNISVY